MHDLYLEICYEFNFDVTMNYSIFRDVSENPFTEYTSPTRKKRAKNADKAALADLDLADGQRFVMALYDLVSPFSESVPPLPSKCIRLELEVRRTKARDINQYYPRVNGESAKFQEMETDWMF